MKCCSASGKVRDLNWISYSGAIAIEPKVQSILLVNKLRGGDCCHIGVLIDDIGNRRAEVGCASKQFVVIDTASLCETVERILKSSIAIVCTLKHELDTAICVKAIIGVVARATYQGGRGTRCRDGSECVTTIAAANLTGILANQEIALVRANNIFNADP